ncbi:Protein-tyrosine phosphatase [Teladorsagia circumcincta]|uniref:Protein-tyrosine phosphatase n=1 Tax=Teladorsagia circumcincta TaxID=45464 RepID=A0A2G9U127_TELCI|nr:Protein-tyrosine phosphatase [Teladorsagia circumcincta]
MRPMSPEEQTVIVSVLIVKFTKPDGASEQREVRHYQWVDWPDRGVPPCRLTSMELLSRVRGTSKPIIVHCSAGIGRTGTVVAIEYILGVFQEFPVFVKNMLWNHTSFSASFVRNPEV